MKFDPLFLQDLYTAFNYEKTCQNLYLGLIFIWSFSIHSDNMVVNSPM